MINWVITRLSIDSFKLFDTKFETLLDSDLVVFDGPNGFGKTSVFDALQLLFCDSIPRIKALTSALRLRATKQFDNNLYWNKQSSKIGKPIVIKVELVNSDDPSNKVCFMRKAEVSDLGNKPSLNKPNEFGLFTLYTLTEFDNEDSKVLISDLDCDSPVKLTIEYLRKHYATLHYLPQNTNSIIIPDESNGKETRFNQISDLLKLGSIDEKIKRNIKLIAAVKKRIKALENDHNNARESLKRYAVSESGPINTRLYNKVTDKKEGIALWDQENPFSNATECSFETELDLLSNVISQKEQIVLRLKNDRLASFVNNDEFTEAVKFGAYINQYENQKALSDKISDLNLKISILNKQNLSNIDQLSLDISTFEKLQGLITQRDQLNNLVDGSNKVKVGLNELRKKLMMDSHVFNEQSDGGECSLCGFDYKSKTLLDETIELRTQKIENELGETANQLQTIQGKLTKLVGSIHLEFEQQRDVLSEQFDQVLLKDLEGSKSRWTTLVKIVKRLTDRNILLQPNYSEDTIEQAVRLNAAKSAVLALQKPENGMLSNEMFTFFKENFNDDKSIAKLSIERVNEKRAYLEYQRIITNNEEHKRLLHASLAAKGKLDKAQVLLEKLNKLNKVTNKIKNDYSQSTIGKMEYLFHIYSGRLIQNYQQGFGLFISLGDQNNPQLNFITSDKSPNDKSNYDAILSLSSGQTAALTLAFFLSLNRVYAKTNFILIDDPTQSMDEINIASLSDLLRVEFRDRQIIISTHEQEIADYLRYRHFRGGLSSQSVNMQNRY